MKKFLHVSCWALLGALILQLALTFTPRPAQAENANAPAWANEVIRELRGIREELHGIKQLYEHR